MGLIHDVRGLFRRGNRPVEIDLTGTQAERLAQALQTMSGEPRNDAMRSTAEQIIDVVQRFGAHLQEQSARQEKLVRLMDRLPAALSALPETARLSASVLEDVHEHVRALAGREDALREAVSRMQDTAARQAEVLGLVRTALEGGHGTLQRVDESIGELGRALTAVADSNARTADALAAATRASAARETELSATLRRAQVWSIVAVATCGAALATAIVFLALG